MNEEKTQAIETRVGLDDAEFLSYTRKDKDRLRVEIRAWNDSHMTFLFEDVLAVLDHGIGDVTAIREVLGVSDFIEQALKYHFEAPVPAEHAFRHYQFLNLDDDPALEIVSTALTIEYSDVQPRPESV